MVDEVWAPCCDFGIAEEQAPAYVQGVHGWDLHRASLESGCDPLPPPISHWQGFKALYFQAVLSRSRAGSCQVLNEIIKIPTFSPSPSSLYNAGN